MSNVADHGPWCLDTGRVRVGLGPPVRCAACSATWADIALGWAADALGLVVFGVVAAGWWGPATRAVERFDRATRWWLDPVVDWTVRRKRGRDADQA